MPPVGFFNSVLPMVILGISYPVHNFNPESRLHFALKSQAPAFRADPVSGTTCVGPLLRHFH